MRDITIKELLYGVAVGDAIGYPLEFINPTEKDFEDSMNRKILEVSDDTQMTLFLAEHLAKNGIYEDVKQAYINWYYTQTQLARNNNLKNSGLLRFEELYHQRAPGNTCLSSCSRLLNNVPVKNDSKGNGCVMRASPWALKWLNHSDIKVDEYMELVKRDCVSTHQHIEAVAATKAFVLILMNLIKGATLLQSLYSTKIHINPKSQTFYFLENIKEIDVTKLQGWVAEDALAIAISSVMRSTNYLEVIKNASMIKGDSDTCAAIAGAIAVCAGMKAPEELIKKLDVLKPIDYIEAIW